MWNKNSQVLFVLIGYLLMEFGVSNWVIYSHFSGYIPSYVYPLELRGGDRISGILSWTGSRDLDLYLYKSGSDILSRYDYLDRQFSFSINPEILDFEIQTSGTYYFRVDLFSSIPTSYKFEIIVNGELIGTYFDDLVTVTTGRTVKIIKFQNNCTAKIIYEGPSGSVYLMQKGDDIEVNSNSIVSNTSLLNPKEMITEVEGMQYSFVVHHGLLSTYSYSMFNVTILTPQDSSKCLSICDGIEYASYLQFNSAERCYCQDGFYWQDDKCLIDCEYFNGTGFRVSGSVDKCQCSNSKQSWNVQKLKCVLNCSRVDNSSGRVGVLGTDEEECTCLDYGFVWEASTYQCKIVCSMHNESNVVGPIQTGSFDVCTCLDSDFEWDSTMNDCRLKCGNFNSSGRVIGPVDNSTQECECIIYFQWNILLRRCEINCSSMNDTGLIGNRAIGYFDQCDCVFPYFNWDSLSDFCVIDCSKFNYTGKVSGIENGSYTSCSCLNQTEKINGTDYEFICFSCDVPYCFECSNFDNLNCASCQTGFQRKSSTNCMQICGDLQVISDECDNHLGILYDGCDDECKVMPDFECRVNDSKSVCSFNATLSVKIISIDELAPSNKLFFKFYIFPPLNIFKVSDSAELSKVFQIENEVLSQQKVEFDFENGILSVLCSMKEGQDFLQGSLLLKFQPSLSFKAQYFATHDQVYNLTVDSTKFGFYFYTDEQIKISSILSYSSFVVVALGFLFFAAGLFAKKLAGLEVLIVCQFAWLVFVEINTLFLLPFGSFYPLKFTSGYNYAFLAETKETSYSSPFVSQFNISSKSNINNLNISLGLVFILLVVVLISYFRFRKATKNKETLKEHSEQTNTSSTEKLFNYYSFSLYLLICLLTLNLLYFVECLSIFLRGPTFTDFIGLAVIGIYGALVILMLVKYFYDYQSFKVFSSSFKNSIPGKVHYPFFWVCLAASAFLFSFPSMLYAPGIPIGVLFIFTVAFRPYFETLDNIRACLNLVVMCGFVGFRVYLSFIPLSELNSERTYYLLIGLVGLLIFLICLAIGITSFFIYKECRKQSNIIQENQEISKMMRREMIDNDFGANLKTSDRSILNMLNNKSHMSHRSDGLDGCETLPGAQERNNLNDSAVGLNNEKRENIRDQLKKLKMIKGSLQRNETKSITVEKKPTFEHTLSVSMAEQTGENNLLNSSMGSI